MSQEPTQCPKCQSESIYPQSSAWVCAECSHEWSPQAQVAPSPASDEKVVKDAFGNVLSNGDSVTLVKDLKIKGAGSGIKLGAKVKNIRLVDGEDGHNIACKIDGVGSIFLKSEFVKKA